MKERGSIVAVAIFTTRKKQGLTDKTELAETNVMIE